MSLSVSDRILPEFMIFQIVPDFLNFKIQTLHYVTSYLKFKLGATRHNLDTIDKSKGEFIF